MSKKNVMPAISDEEFNSMVGMDYPHTGTGNDTESIVQTDDAEKRTIPEPTMESVRKVANIENVASTSNKPSENIAPAMPSRTTVPTMPESPSVDISPTQSTQPTQQRMSSRQRKASLDEYRETFMSVPKIIDRQPVFISRETRDSIDSVVRRLGERKMSVSGFLENLAHHHLELYADDLEQWKRL